MPATPGFEGASCTLSATECPAIVPSPRPLIRTTEPALSRVAVVERPETTDHPETTAATTPATTPEADLPEATYLTPLDRATQSGQALASRFSNLQPWQCRDELRKRKIVTRPAGMPALGVATPLRLPATLGAVRFVTPNAKSVYGILDCRLSLLLHEIAPTLSALQVREIYIDNFYRPRAHLPGKKSPSQHSFGLAIDIAGFGLSDGTVLQIERDFNGTLGAPVCGPDAAFTERTRASVLLRNIVCKLAALRTFNYFLTPNYDTAHRNHLHGDIKRKSVDFVVR